MVILSIPKWLRMAHILPRDGKSTLSFSLFILIMIECGKKRSNATECARETNERQWNRF